MHKKNSFSIIVSLLVAHTISAQQTFTPRRLNALVDQYISVLEAKRKMLDQKILTSKAHQAHAIKKQTELSGTARSAQFRTLAELNQSALDGMQAAQADIHKRLEALIKDKTEFAKLPIKDAAEEAAHIRKMMTTQSISDLEQRIREIVREEGVLSKQAGVGDAQAVNSLVSQRKVMEMKLLKEKQVREKLA